MTPLPKRRLSTRRQGKRRASFALSIVGLVLCANCKKPMVPHRVCPHCGYYKGRLVKPPKTKGKQK